MAVNKLTPAEAEKILASLENSAETCWTLDDDSLCKTFTFADFTAAFEFMTQAATIAERMDHHPDWCNSYNTVTVKLSTHKVGGLTELDFELARAMDSIEP